MPSSVTILRHAEKQVGEGPPFSVASDGSRDPESLSVRGWQRAGALVGLLSGSTPQREAARAIRPGHLFASRVGESTSLSRRPRETLEPLSDLLGSAIDDRFLKTQVADLVVAILACEGDVIVAWEHRLIPAIATALVADPTTVPGTWPDDRFDVLWVLEPRPGSAPYTLRQVPQMLLAGDRNHGIDGVVQPV